MSLDSLLSEAAKAGLEAKQATMKICNIVDRIAKSHDPLIQAQGDRVVELATTIFLGVQVSGIKQSTLLAAFKGIMDKMKVENINASTDAEIVLPDFGDLDITDEMVIGATDVRIRAAELESSYALDGEVGAEPLTEQVEDMTGKTMGDLRAAMTEGMEIVSLNRLSVANTGNHGPSPGTAMNQRIAAHALASALPPKTQCEDYVMARFDKLLTLGPNLVKDALVDGDGYSWPVVDRNVVSKMFKAGSEDCIWLGAVPLAVKMTSAEMARLKGRYSAVYKSDVAKYQNPLPPPSVNFVASGKMTVDTILATNFFSGAGDADSTLKKMGVRIIGNLRSRFGRVMRSVGADNAGYMTIEDVVYAMKTRGIFWADNGVGCDPDLIPYLVAKVKLDFQQASFETQRPGVFRLLNQVC